MVALLVLFSLNYLEEIQKNFYVYCKVNNFLSYYGVIGRALTAPKMIFGLFTVIKRIV